MSSYIEDIQSQGRINRKPIEVKIHFLFMTPFNPPYSIRFAKIFTGTKHRAEHKIVAQQLLPSTLDDGPMYIWVDIPTVWITPEDEKKNENAVKYECQHQSR